MTTKIAFSAVPVLLLALSLAACAGEISTTDCVGSHCNGLTEESDCGATSKTDGGAASAQTDAGHAGTEADSGHANTETDSGTETVTADSGTESTGGKADACSCPCQHATPDSGLTATAADATPTKTDTTVSEADASPTKADAAPTQADASPTKADAMPVEADAGAPKADATPTPAVDATPMPADPTIDCKRSSSELTVTITGPLSARLMGTVANPTAIQFGSNTLGGWGTCYGSGDPRPSLTYTNDVGPYTFHLPPQADQMNFYVVDGKCAAVVWFDLETAATPEIWTVSGDCKISGTLLVQK